MFGFLLFFVNKVVYVSKDLSIAVAIILAYKKGY